MCKPYMDNYNESYSRNKDVKLHNIPPPKKKLKKLMVATSPKLFLFISFISKKNYGAFPLTFFPITKSKSSYFKFFFGAPKLRVCIDYSYWVTSLRGSDKLLKLT